VASGGHPHSIHKCVDQHEDLGGERQTKNDVTNLLLLAGGFMSAMSLHTFLILKLRSAVKFEYQIGCPCTLKDSTN